jgi:predicted aspartyl protease
MSVAEMDRRAVLSGAGAFAFAAAAAPSVARADSPKVDTQRTATRIVVQGQTPTVSLQTWMDNYGRPTARVTVNGQGPFRFLVDTGSTTSVVSTRLARQLNLPTLPAQMIHSVTSAAMAPFVAVASLEAGAARPANLRAAVMDGPAFANADGILGMDAFANTRVRFSLSRREVEILPTGQRLAPLPIAVPVSLRNGMLLETRGRVGHVVARCILDTGAETSMINAPLSERLLRGRANLRNREPAIIMGVSQTVLNGLWVRVPLIQTLGLRVSGLSVISAPSPVFRIWGLDELPAMIVGMDVLSGLETLQIDYRRKQVQLRLLSLMSGGAGVATG